LFESVKKRQGTTKRLNAVPQGKDTWENFKLRGKKGAAKPSPKKFKKKVKMAKTSKTKKSQEGT